LRFPFKIGLKLHSTNTDLISEAVTLWRDDIFQYIELYIVPGTYSSTHEKWSACNIPFILHAAHSYDGINLALRKQWEQNRYLLREVQQFADNLNVQMIIIHGGMNGSIEETIHQIKRLGETRLLLENKPRVAINGERCVGWSPEEFFKAAESQVLKGFVLDFGHAQCAAFSMGRKAMDVVQEFLAFSPNIYHVSDGVSKNEKDTHRNFGMGDRKLTEFIEVIPESAYVTVETPRGPFKGLKDFVVDIKYLEALF